MKKQIAIILAVAAVYTYVPYAAAQTKTASPSPTLKVSPTTTEDKEIKDLREKIATKVAELRKNQKAVAGYITSSKDNVIKIKTDDDTEYDVKIDDTLTTYHQVDGTSLKDLKLSDISTGSYIIVTGPVLDKSINANSIYVDEPFIVKSGTITQIDTDNGTISVMSTEKDNYKLEYSRTTKYQLMDVKTLELDTVLLSKIKEGDTIHFVGTAKAGSADKLTLSLSKAVVIPQEYFAK